MKLFISRLKHCTVLLLAAWLAGCAAAAIQYRDVIAPEAAGIVPVKSDRPLVALVLGSGGSHGFAHVGVIKALEDAGISADLVVGTSAGSVVGALYAGGIKGSRLEELALQLESQQLSDFSLSGRGFIRGELLQDFVNKALGNRSIEQLEKPFAAVATDLKTGRITVFNRGNTGLAVRASSSVPGVFQPVTIGQTDYVDGDLKSPVPVKVARAMGADLVIAVDISETVDRHDTAGLLDTLRQSLRIMRHSIIENEIPAADVIIRPHLAPMGLLDFKSKQQFMAEGERAAQAAVPQIRQLLEQAAREKTAGRAAR